MVVEEIYGEPIEWGRCAHCGHPIELFDPAGPTPAYWVHLEIPGESDAMGDGGMSIWCHVARAEPLRLGGSA